MENPKRISTAQVKVIGDGLGVFDPQQRVAYVLNATRPWSGSNATTATTPTTPVTLYLLQYNLSFSDLLP